MHHKKTIVACKEITRQDIMLTSWPRTGPWSSWYVYSDTGRNRHAAAERDLDPEELDYQLSVLFSTPDCRGR